MSNRGKGTYNLYFSRKRDRADILLRLRLFIIPFSLSSINNLLFDIGRYLAISLIPLPFDRYISQSNKALFK